MQTISSSIALGLVNKQFMRFYTTS